MRGLATGLLLAWLAGSALPAEPHLKDVRVAVSGRSVEVTWELREAFSEETLERIRTGLPTGYLFQFRLDRDRKRWFDASLATASLQVVAMYNAVTSEYLVNYKLDGELIESRVVRNPVDLERALTGFQRIPIFDLEDVVGTDLMLVRARADLGPETGLLFLPTRATTGWHRSRKFRPADEAG